MTYSDEIYKIRQKYYLSQETTGRELLMVAEDSASYGEKKDGEYYGRYCFRITE